MDSAKIGFVSLGCAKATVDSERILTELRVRGYVISADYETSDLVIVNTCGFIDSAVEESLQAIGEAMYQNGKVIVTGCLGAKGDIIKQHYDKVLAITGPHATEEVIDAVMEHLPMAQAHDPYFDLVPPGGLKLTPRHYAYLKISEGCNHRCRFCIIPQMRGKLESRPAVEVMAEAEALVGAGVQELLIVSQDTSAYGSDLKYRSDFYNSSVGALPLRSHIYDLCKALGSLGVWVRLHYVYPYPHVDQLIPLMAESVLLPYLDIPFQHASPQVLKSMRRPAHSEKVLHRIKNWREICPEITIRSTFIVGYPGETEEDFDMLLDFLEQAQIDRVGCFQYSNVEGAAANALENQLPEEVKQERFHRLMSLQSEISTNCLNKKLGKEQIILLDQIDGEIGIGRTVGDAPEVDGIVEVAPLKGGFYPGNKIKVKITGSTDYDLIATPI